MENGRNYQCQFATSERYGLSFEGDLFGVLMHEIDHERSITDWCQNLIETPVNRFSLAFNSHL